MNKNTLVYSNKFFSTNNSEDLSINDFNIEKLSKIRHFPPAVREWTDSIYSFNKNNSNDSVTKFNQLDNLIKNYFNIANNLKLGRSKRIRYSRKISKSRRAYLSKPEIKQTNDKITVTVYCLDRDRQVLTRKLFYHNRPKIYNILLKRYKKNYKMMIKNQLVKYDLPLSDIKFSKELKFLREKNNVKNKRLEQLTKFQFFKYILSMLGIQLIIPLYSPLLYFYEKHNKLRYSYINTKKLKKVNYDMIIKAIKDNPHTIYWINNTTNSIEKIEKNDINFELLKKYITERNFINKNKLTGKITHYTSLNKLTEINNKLSIIIYKRLYISEITLFKLFNNLFIRLGKYSIIHLYRKRADNILKLTNLFGYNLFRFKTLLPVLKKLIDDLYNKKVELNIVNLKYYYLNSDIFTQLLISKIRKDLSAVKVLKKSIYNIKVYASLLGKNIEKINRFNNIKFLSINKNLSLRKLNNNFLPNLTHDSSKMLSQTYKNVNNNSVNNNTDKLDTVFNKLYPNTKINYKISNILNTIRYKSILGIWIEAKGRLTRRNTAARSVRHIVYKGDLKDKDQYIHLNMINNIPTVILRNNGRSNSDYVSKGSAKRIGTFGIKTWINTK